VIRCPHCATEFVPAHVALTKTQHETLVYLAAYIDRNGFAPSFEEIADNFGLASLSSVFDRLTDLARKGVIRRTYNEIRAITILVRPDELQRCTPKNAEASA
jgi:SOS-response transcriptional repressor LexA